MRYALTLLILATVFAFFSPRVHAAPFVLGDVPSTAANKCVWSWQSTQVINDVVVDSVNGSPTYSNRVCKLDVASAVVGNNSVTLALRDSTNMWGDSAAVPFSFVRPTAPPSPASLRLVPQ